MQEKATQPLKYYKGKICPGWNIWQVMDIFAFKISCLFKVQLIVVKTGMFPLTFIQNAINV